MRPLVGQLRYRQKSLLWFRIHSMLDEEGVWLAWSGEGSVSGSGFGSGTGPIILLEKLSTLSDISKEPNS